MRRLRSWTPTGLIRNADAPSRTTPDTASTTSHVCMPRPRSFFSDLTSKKKGPMWFLAILSLPWFLVRPPPMAGKEDPTTQIPDARIQFPDPRSWTKCVHCGKANVGSNKLMWCSKCKAVTYFSKECAPAGCEEGLHAGSSTSLVWLRGSWPPMMT